MKLRDFLDAWADLGLRDYAVHMLAYAMIALLLSVLGPFGTDGDPFLWRFSYWTMMMGIFGGLVMPLVARALRNSIRFCRLPILPGAIVALCLAAVPMTLFVGLGDRLFRRIANWAERLPFVDIRRVRADLGPEQPLAWGDSALLYLQVLAIVIVSIGLVSLYIVQTHRNPAGGAAADPLTRPGVRFLSRLPARIGSDILYLQMEDHYVRVVTAKGNALLLMRLRDAVEELDGLPGLQVHRSWWIAAAHVVRMARDGRRRDLQMTDGTMVPVSASYRAAVDALLMRPVATRGRA